MARGCRTCRSARSVIGAHAGGDEQGGGLTLDVGGVPHAGRVNRVIARREMDALDPAIGELLEERDPARGADHHLGALGMDFPPLPAFREGVERDEAAFLAIAGMALGIGGVPIHAVESGFGGGGSAEAEMGEMGEEAGHDVGMLGGWRRLDRDWVGAAVSGILW